MNPPTHTTLAALAAHNPCKPGRDRLLAGLGKTEADSEPLALLKVLEINGLQDTLWCIERVWPDKLRLRLACRFARQVEHLLPQQSRDALEVIDRYAEGAASEAEFKEAAAAAAARAYAYVYADAATRAAAADRAKQIQILREFLAELEGGAA